jgi:hypothetical protein
VRAIVGRALEGLKLGAEARRAQAAGEIGRARAIGDDRDVGGPGVVRREVLWA